MGQFFKMLLSRILNKCKVAFINLFFPYSQNCDDQLRLLDIYSNYITIYIRSFKKLLMNIKKRKYTNIMESSPSHLTKLMKEKSLH